MQLLFIRHAQSLDREKGNRQAPDSPLGKIGHKQARLIAARIKRAINSSGQSYDLILTSPWPRAAQTADVISRVTGLPVSPHPLIHEYLSHSIIFGKPMNSEIVREYNRAVREKGIDFNWRYGSEGESLRDVINRVQAFRQELLTSYLGKNYLVVSHGLFITTFVTLLILGEDYRDSAFMRVYGLIRLENTSLTHLEYDEAENKWKIKFLNDHSHLFGH